MKRRIIRIFSVVSLLLCLACVILWIRGLYRGDRLCFVPHPSSQTPTCYCLETRPHGLGIARGSSSGLWWWRQASPAAPWIAFSIPWDEPLMIHVNQWPPGPGWQLPGSGSGLRLTAPRISASSVDSVSVSDLSVSGGKIAGNFGVVGPAVAGEIRVDGEIQSNAPGGTILLTMSPPLVPEHHFLGFGWEPAGPGLLGTALFDGPPWRHVVVPWWFIILLFAILPLISLGRLLRRRRRVKLGLCLTCGYDLRARGAVSRMRHCNPQLRQ